MRISFSSFHSPETFVNKFLFFFFFFFFFLLQGTPLTQYLTGCLTLGNYIKAVWQKCSQATMKCLHPGDIGAAKGEPQASIIRAHMRQPIPSHLSIAAPPRKNHQLCRREYKYELIFEFSDWALILGPLT
jgi:hypothetical protein